MKRICIYVIYDSKDIVDKYIDAELNELRKYASKVIVVCNSISFTQMDSVEVDELIYRQNRGFDASAYAEAIELYRDLIQEYDELLITNDTYYGPIYSYEDMFSKMNKDDCDYWGITKHPGGHCGEIEINEHIQSYFLNFKSRIIHDNTFYDFWNNLIVSNNVNDAIINFEVGISNFLKEAGYKGSTFMECNGFDIPLYKEDNPYLMYPYELVKQYGVPIIKRKCLDFNSEWYENAIKALEYIREETKYDVNLIIEHMRRLSTIESGEVHYNYVKLYDFIKSHDNIYIYGNGKWAHNMDAYFRFNGFVTPMHIVSDKKDSDQSVMAFSDVETTDDSGIIIAVSNPKAICEIYAICLSKFIYSNIFCPEY